MADSLAIRPYQSPLSRFREGMQTFAVVKEKAAPAARVAAMAFRGQLETVTVGALLGLLDTELGSLDHGIGKIKVPIDGAASLAALVGAFAFASSPDGIASDFLNVSNAASAVFAFRSAKKWREEHKSGHAGAGHHGDDGVDPILAAAASLRDQ